MQCPEGNRTKYLDNIVCITRTVNKGIYSFTSLMDIVRPITYAIVDYKLIYVPSNKVLFNYSFEYCKSFEKLPPLVNFVANYINTNVGDNIHACPYLPQKRYGIENLLIDANAPIFAIAKFQRGEYFSYLHVNDKDGNLIGKQDATFLLTISHRRKAKKAGRK